MRIKSWISLALLAGAVSAATLTLPEGGTVTAVATENHIRFSLPGASAPIIVNRDSAIDPKAPVEKLQLVSKEKQVLILRDSYPSRNGSMSYCQAGTEEFLRVLSLGRAPKQTLCLKIASCRDNIELASPGITWDAPNRLLSIHWLTPAKGSGSRIAYRIGEDASVKSVKP